MRFTGCAHATRLDLDHLQGRGPEPAEDSADADLLQRHGDAHEAEHLARLKGRGEVAEIDKEQPFHQAVETTVVALRSGEPVVFQGALEGGAWGGWSDFLERVEEPSDLGTFSYEVADTKLKRKPAPGHVLQLVLYSDLLARVQGRAPERAHVELGDGSQCTFRLAEYHAYARKARERLESFVARPWPTRPVPTAACPLCRWRDHCADRWTAEDSLFEVAGITRSQVAKLEAAGVTTLAALAEREERVPKLAPPTLDRLRLQARLQHARKSGPPLHELREALPGKGFDLLPRPDPGDLFYDIEGDPFYAEGGVDGLEYLHGVWDGADFTALWAHDHGGERETLIRLLDLFEARLTAHPQAHIYHYAAYEITALRRLCTRHGVGEARLDRWLRERRFCDLYAVVRGGVAASEPSYSIKDMEAFYGIERTGEVTTAGGSVVAYEEWRETREQAILDEIEDYNRIDCISTEALRDWLVRIRPDRPWPEPAPPQDERYNADDAEAEALRQRLLAADLPEGRGQLLFDLARFHKREAKPAAWEVFDAAARDADDLCEDMDCLGGLVATGPQESEKKSIKRTYRFPRQETKLRSGKKACIRLGEKTPTVEILDLDRRRRSVTIKLGPKGGDRLPDRLDLLPTFAIDPRPIPGALLRVVEDQLGPRANRAADDLLSRRPPRFAGAGPLPVSDGADPVEAIIGAVGAMDATVLPVQGPPGTGKTYVTARAILALVREGKRVAISSNSHEAIRNVLMGCIDAWDWDDPELDLHLVHKGKEDLDELVAPSDRIEMVTKADDISGSAQVVGGTAWLFAAEEMQGVFDTLFLDEAGQVSLANLVAMTNAARNVVLVGDPNQLPQVIQGAHPHPAALSGLDWMLGGETVVPRERGLFLPLTRRMHPDICRYISNQFYAGRLHAHESTALQSVRGEGLPPAGAFLVPVEHEGRAQECPEEVEGIREAVTRLLSGNWTDREGETRRLRQSDIIVVAPYNAQVNALSDALPGIRVGTVDRFQGKEAAVALVAMTASSAEETSRGLDFLLARERLNVAVSRGKALSLVFASPRLLATPCATVEQMRLVNSLCALQMWRGRKLIA